jgi:hypothetical protein
MRQCVGGSLMLDLYSGMHAQLEFLHLYSGIQAQQDFVHLYSGIQIYTTI